MKFLLLCTLLTGSFGLILNETAIDPPRVTYFRHLTAGFGARPGSSAYEITAPLVVVKPKYGCGRIQNKRALDGAIAIVRRGGCAFVKKAYNVEMYGVVGMVVGNYVNGEERLIHMRKTHDEDDVDFPSLFVSKSTYDKVVASVKGDLAGTAWLIISQDGEQYSATLWSLSGLLTMVVWLAMVICVVWVILSTIRFCWRRLIVRRQRKLRQIRNSKIPEISFTPDLLEDTVNEENIAQPRVYLMNNSCPICLENFEEQVQIKLLPCNHGFHSDCIDPWIVQKNNDTCPICRQTVADKLQYEDCGAALCCCCICFQSSPILRGYGQHLLRNDQAYRGSADIEPLQARSPERAANVELTLRTF